MLDNEGYIHTLRICNTYFFSTATMVTRARLIVTFIRTVPVLLLRLFIDLTGRFHLRYSSALNALKVHAETAVRVTHVCTFAESRTVYIATFVGPWYRNCAVPRRTVI